SQRSNKRPRYEFELDVPKLLIDTKSHEQKQDEAMLYVFTYGQKKGQSVAAIMKTQDGRAYLKRWRCVKLPDENDEFYNAVVRRNEIIDLAFEVYNEHTGNI